MHGEEPGGGRSGAPRIPGREPGSPSEDEGRGPPEILVLAADPDMRLYVRQCLERHSRPLRLTELRSFGLALERLRVTWPDLVIADVDGAAGDPAAAAAALRAVLDPARGLLVLTDEPGGVKARLVGAAVLGKPFNARRLCDRVEELLAACGRGLPANAPRRAPEASSGVHNRSPPPLTGDGKT